MPPAFCHLVTSIRPYVQLCHNLCGLLMGQSYTKIERNVNRVGEKVNMLNTKLFIFIQTRYKNSLRHAKHVCHLVLVK